MLPILCYFVVLSTASCENCIIINSSSHKKSDVKSEKNHVIAQSKRIYCNEVDDCEAAGNYQQSHVFFESENVPILGYQTKIRISKPANPSNGVFVESRRVDLRKVHKTNIIIHSRSKTPGTANSEKCLRHNTKVSSISVSARIVLTSNPLPSSSAWSNWTPWSACSEECDGGTKNRTRVCENSDSSLCPGEDVEVQDCNTFDCERSKFLFDFLGFDF